MDNDLKRMLTEHENRVARKASEQVSKKARLERRRTLNERREAQKFVNSVLVNVKSVTDKMNDVKGNMMEMIKKVNQELVLSRKAQKNSKKSFNKRSK